MMDEREIIRELYRKYMDLFVPEIRRVLIDHIFQVRQHVQDPVVSYWINARVLSPKRVVLFERWLAFKKKIKKLIGRK